MATLFGFRFSENLKFLNSCILHSHGEGIYHSYQGYVQTSVCMFIVPTNKVKMPFCIIVDIFLLFSQA